MRAIWKGAVSFGLVYVPVKLYAATEHKDVKFSYLHGKCRTPVQYRRYCPHCQAEVAPEEIVKGYEYEKGRYVVLQDGDFEEMGAEGGGKNIGILAFVNQADIDPIYYEKPYYLAPADGGARVYELLRRAMLATGKVALARVVIRSRESLAAVRVGTDALVMSTMHYPDEIRAAGTLPELNYRVALADNEIKMAVNLIHSLAADFRPEKYTDTYRQNVLSAIQAKISGERVQAPAGPETGRVVDLMEALKASIELAREERAGKAPKAGKTQSRRKTS